MSFRRKHYKWPIKPRFGYGIDWNDPINYGCLARYLFNEGAGIKAQDLTGRYNGTLINGPLWVPSKFGTGIQFDGVNDYIDRTNFSLPDTTHASMMVWFNYTAVATQRPINQGDSFGNNLVIQIVSGTGVRGLIGGGGGGTQIGTTVTTTTNTWYHVVVTYDGVSLKLYLNGVLAANDAKTTTFATTGQDFRIGQEANNPNVEPFAGIIDNAGIWGRTLTAAEVMRLYSNPSAGVLTPRRWIFNSNTGAVVAANRIFFPSQNSAMGVGGVLGGNRYN